jgi:LCP family protein required for cell wall assembly
MKMGVDLTGRIWETMTGSFESEVALAEDKDYLDEEDLVSDAEEADLSQIKWPEHPGDGRQEEGVYNVLLLGEEAIGQGTSRGRTDVIIIATLNTKQKTVKLTSILRDTLVQIPGYKDNKLNSAYEKGGLELMYETIALNFDIRLDGCVMVNFENFEKIIDRLDGLDITLTSGEAKYLRNTNYISDPDNRTVQEGVNHMNGNQVLGYVRVRKRATITGNNNDYGRTDRHRIVLNAIFEKYKTKSKVELATIMLGVLPMIKTDIDNENFEILLNTFIEMGTTEIEQLRIPADGTFTDNIEVRGMDVLIPEYDENIDILHEFVFGKDSAVKDTSDN